MPAWPSGLGWLADGRLLIVSMTNRRLLRLDADGLKAAVTELETGPYSEDPWSKLVEVITLDQAARAFLP